MPINEYKPSINAGLGNMCEGLGSLPWSNARGHDGYARGGFVDGPVFLGQLEYRRACREANLEKDR